MVESCDRYGQNLEKYGQDLKSYGKSLRGFREAADEVNLIQHESVGEELEDGFYIYQLFDEMSDSDEDLLNVYHLFDVMPLREIEVFGEVSDVIKEELEADLLCIYNLFDETPLNQIEVCVDVGDAIKEHLEEDSFGIHQLFEEMPNGNTKNNVIQLERPLLPPEPPPNYYRKFCGIQEEDTLGLGKLFDETPLNHIEDRCDVCDTLNELKEDPFRLSNLFDEMPEGEIRRYDMVYGISQLFDKMSQREIRKYDEFYEVYQLFDEIPQCEIRKYDEVYEIHHLFDEKACNETRICGDVLEVLNEKYEEGVCDVYMLFAEIPESEIRMYDKVCDVRSERLEDANEIHQVLEEMDKHCTRFEAYSRITDKYVYHLSHFDKSSPRPGGLFMEPTLGEVVGYGKLAKNDLRYCVYIPTQGFENYVSNYSCTQNSVTHKFSACYMINWNSYFALQHQILKFKSWEERVELEYLKKHGVPTVLMPSKHNGARICGCCWGGLNSLKKWTSGVLLGGTVVGVNDEHFWVDRSDLDPQIDLLALHQEVRMGFDTVALGKTIGCVREPTKHDCNDSVCNPTHVLHNFLSNYSVLDSEVDGFSQVLRTRLLKGGSSVIAPTSLSVGIAAIAARELFNGIIKCYRHNRSVVMNVVRQRTGVISKFGACICISHEVWANKSDYHQALLVTNLMIFVYCIIDANMEFTVCAHLVYWRNFITDMFSILVGKVFATLEPLQRKFRASTEIDGYLRRGKTSAQVNKTESKDVTSMLVECIINSGTKVADTYGTITNLNNFSALCREQILGGHLCYLLRNSLHSKCNTNI